MDHCLAIPASTTRHTVARLAAVAVVAGCVAALIAPCAFAYKTGKTHKETKRSESHEIEGLEGQWRDAMVKGDTPALDKLLADDFLAISANGTLSDKEQYIHRVEVRENAFTTIEPLDIKVRILPSTAIVTSQVRVIGLLDHRPIDGVYRYTKVYRRGSAGQWVVLNFEATRVSGSRTDQTEMHPGMPLDTSHAH